jgi:hypothetical protein
MPSDPLLWWFLLVAVTALDIVLWSSAILGATNSETRFRLLFAAAILLLVVVGMTLGAATAIVAGVISLWVYSIIAGAGQQPNPS